MSDVSWPVEAREADAQFGDYYQLLKPRVMRLVVFTAVVGLICAPVPVHPVLALAAIICIAVGAGASGALNMWSDWDIDSAMGRTRSRPIPSGRVSRAEALGIGVTLGCFSVVMLALFANLFSAALLAITILFYAVVYSLWLKRATPQNIVIGGAAGAIPPVIGWAVATGGPSVESLLMFAIIFLWTPPHFWALALFRNDDYERAGVPMMTVVAGPRSTRHQIFLYALLLAPVAILPAFTMVGGPVYLAGALILNALFLRGAWQLRGRDEATALADRFIVEKRFFGFSIAYLFLHFCLFLIEAGLHAAGTFPAGWPILV